MSYTPGVYFSLKCVDSTFAHWLYTHKVCCLIRGKKKTHLEVCTMGNAARTCWISRYWVRISGNTHCINSCTYSNTRRKCVMCRFNSHNNTAVFTVQLLLINYFKKSLCSLRLARRIFPSRSNLIVLSWWLTLKHCTRFWEDTIVWTIVIDFYSEKSLCSLRLARGFFLCSFKLGSFIMLNVLDALDDISLGNYRLNICY